MNDYQMMLGMGQLNGTGLEAVALVAGAVISAVGLVVGMDRWFEMPGTAAREEARPITISNATWSGVTAARAATDPGCVAR